MPRVPVSIYITQQPRAPHSVEDAVTTSHGLTSIQLLRRATPFVHTAKP